MSSGIIISTMIERTANECVLNISELLQFGQEKADLDRFAKIAGRHPHTGHFANTDLSCNNASETI